MQLQHTIAWLHLSPNNIYNIFHMSRIIINLSCFYCYGYRPNNVQPAPRIKVLDTQHIYWQQEIPRTQILGTQLHHMTCIGHQDFRSFVAEYSQYMEWAPNVCVLKVFAQKTKSLQPLPLNRGCMNTGSPDYILSTPLFTLLYRHGITMHSY